MDKCKEMDVIIIHRNGVSIFVERENLESNHSLWRRGWFIIKQKIISNDDYNHAVMSSRVWKNTSMGCQYLPEWTSSITKSSRSYFI